MNGMACCCKLIQDLVKKQEQCLIQQLITNSNQIKICTYLENLDKKINKILESDKRTQNLSFPQPKLPVPFLELLPASSTAHLDAIEKLLSSDHASGHNAEELVGFYDIKHY